LKRLVLLLSVLACAAVFASPAGAVETLSLDLSSAANVDSDPANSPVTSAPLTAGQQYIFTVQGTGSIWTPGAFEAHGTCGIAEAGPMYPSPGRINSAAGWDAATVFAAPKDANISTYGQACTTVPLPMSLIDPTRDPAAGFEYAAGAKYVRGVPIGGAPSTPNAAHIYSWAITGTGTPLHFRFADNPSTDDSGVFHIALCAASEAPGGVCVPPASAGGGSNGAGAILTNPVLPTASVASVKVSGTRTCHAVPVVTVNVTQPLGVKYQKATYLFNGKKIRVLYRTTSRKNRQLVYVNGKKVGLVRPQTFTGRGRAKLKLRIELVTATNQTIVAKRTISACSKTKKTIHFS
jgi:hypothetical protein